MTFQMQEDLNKEIELILLPAEAEGWTPTGAKRPSKVQQHGQGSPTFKEPQSGLINSCLVIWHRSCFAVGCPKWACCCGFILLIVLLSACFVSVVTEVTDELKFE